MSLISDIKAYMDERKEELLREGFGNLRGATTDGAILHFAVTKGRLAELEDLENKISQLEKREP